MNPVLTRPFLKLPTWVWLFVPILLATVVFSMGPPENLPEPPLAAKAFQKPVLVTTTGKSFRIVQNAGVQPLWFIGVAGDVWPSPATWQFGWVDGQLILGLYRRESRWMYKLVSSPTENSFKDGKVTVPNLTPPEMEIVRGLLKDELNQRYPEEQLGTQLEKALAGGIEHVSYQSPQNTLIMLLWIALVAAFVAVWFSVIGERRNP